MKKSILITLAFSILVVLTTGSVVNLREIICDNNTHDCNTHLAEAKSNGDRCPTCFSYYDDYNYCPTCDYEYCPGCTEWTLLKEVEFCKQCGYSPERECKRCGQVSYKCDCENPVF